MSAFFAAQFQYPTETLEREETVSGCKASGVVE